MALSLGKLSVGVGDRFAHQAKAQLRAFQRAAEAGIDIVPVWNKSHREHLIVGSRPADVRMAAAEAVAALGWDKPYHVDADHINRETVPPFIEASDFYTIDVADRIGEKPEPFEVMAFVDRHRSELVGEIDVPNLPEPLHTSLTEVERIVAKHLPAVQEAGAIHRYIVELRGDEEFITEISMDETDSPQTPLELLVILIAIADERIPAQTIAPKFTGRFNKGVDYIGDLEQFEREFRDDLAVIAYAVARHALPANLKLSVHSGSDKFSLYGPIRRALKQFNAGLHLKTAGTTWLEELTGLAAAGGEGLALAKEIYAGALEHADDLCRPYRSVIAIDSNRLPSQSEVNGWSSETFVQTLSHDPAQPDYNPHFRQLLHVGFKIAAALGPRYLEALNVHEEVIAERVTDNLFERHMKPLFLGGKA